MASSICESCATVRRCCLAALPRHAAPAPGLPPARRVGDCLCAQRLAATGDYSGNVQAPDELYDDALVEAVKAFQKRHGIDIDGIVGPAMTRAMNVTAKQRVDQIRVNMERARWGARTLRKQKDLVVVNIAGFYLTV